LLYDATPRERLGKVGEFENRTREGGKGRKGRKGEGKFTLRQGTTCDSKIKKEINEEKY